MASTQERTNEMRALGYMCGVFATQLTDPVCGECRKIPSTHEKLSAHVASLQALPEGELNPAELARLQSMGQMLAASSLPADPKPQRKGGACKLPGGECIIKHSRNLYKRIQGIEEGGSHE